MQNNSTIKVPKKYQHMIELIDDEGTEGYWVYTNHGYYSPDMECHTIHEYTQAEVLQKIRNIEPCNCKECIQGLTEQKQA